jgi:hypothetical protein
MIGKTWISTEALKASAVEFLEKIMDEPDGYTKDTVQRACEIFEARQVDELLASDKMNAFFENL